MTIIVIFRGNLLPLTATQRMEIEFQDLFIRKYQWFEKNVDHCIMGMKDLNNMTAVDTQTTIWITAIFELKFFIQRRSLE